MPYGGHPSTDIDDAIRFLIGDTDPTRPLLSDDELAYLRDQYGDNPLRVAAEAADALAAKFALLVDQTVGRVSVSYSQRATQFRALAAELRRRMARSGKPYFGGVSVADMDAEEADTDRPEPLFAIGQDDNESGSGREEVS